MVFLPSIHEKDGQLDRISGDSEGQDGGHQTDDQQGNEVFGENVKVVDDADTGGNKKESHVSEEKIRLLPDVAHLDNLEKEKQEQQDHTDHAGGKGKGEKRFDDRAEPADGKDNGDLT